MRRGNEMSALTKLKALSLKHDGRIPQDELKAALGSQATDWADARFQQNYFEDRMMLNWQALENETHPTLIKGRWEKHEYFLSQAKEWRDTADMLDWQNQTAMAAE